MSFFDLSSPSKGVISVTELNRAARELLESGFPVLWVAGEISNFKRYDSGHCYFSLKDGSAQVRCVMFRNRAVLLDFKPVEGMQVEARALVSLYEARGDFQLTVEALRPAGAGALFAAFEQLKKKLDTEGLFAANRKRPLPVFPRAIGVVTSPAAAALRDVVTTLQRRWPGLLVILYPTPVQGADAGRQIAAAIQAASRRREVDALLVCRGGGSLEDLWAFNEEVVARAIATCAIPVISGVGHETDSTIADFVADLRAPTPTAAAELATASRESWLARVQQLQQRLRLAGEWQLQVRMQRLDLLGRRLQHPGERLLRQQERILALRQRLLSFPQRWLERQTFQLGRLQLRLHHALPRLEPLQIHLAQLQNRLRSALPRQQLLLQQRLDVLRARLQAQNPEAPLARGYVLVSRADGSLVQTAHELRLDERVQLRFADAQAEAAITQLPKNLDKGTK